MKGEIILNELFYPDSNNFSIITPVKYYDGTTNILS